MLNKKEKVKNYPPKKKQKTNMNEISVFQSKGNKTHIKDSKSLDERGTKEVIFKSNITISNKNTKIMEYTDDEINELSYNLALLNEKRTF